MSDEERNARVEVLLADMESLGVRIVALPCGCLDVICPPQLGLSGAILLELRELKQEFVACLRARMETDEEFLKACGISNLCAERTEEKMT